MNSTYVKIVSMDLRPATLEISRTGTTLHLLSGGDWTIPTLPKVEHQLKRLLPTARKGGKIVWDISKVRKFDSAGMMLLIEFEERFKKRDNPIRISGFSDEHRRIYNLLRNNLKEKLPPPSKSSPFTRALERTGMGVSRFVADILAFFTFVGAITVQLFYYIRHPSSIRYKAIVKQIYASAISALGIIALTSFLIGVVVAYQSGVQLERFGAGIFIIDMIGISITRELAPLITAIVVAGRSGSSFTAQLGVMKLTEEIDAMKTMGFEPFRFLVLPRIIALMISLPLLIFFADIVGIFGGMVVADAQLHITYSSFVDHLQNALDVKHYWVGIVKGPFFAWLIAAIGCFRGLQVTRDTESIGRYTTISVVNAIFLVIACDALFSIVLTELDI